MFVHPFIPSKLDHTYLPCLFNYSLGNTDWYNALKLPNIFGDACDF